MTLFLFYHYSYFIVIYYIPPVIFYFDSLSYHFFPQNSLYEIDEEVQFTDNPMDRNKPKSVNKEPIVNRSEIGEKRHSGNYESSIEDVYHEPGPADFVNPM